MTQKKKIFLSLALTVFLSGAQLPGVSWAAQPAADVQDAAVQKTMPPMKRYTGYIWRLDAKNQAQLPRNFRMANSPYRTDAAPEKTGQDFVKNPVREGLDTLPISGSAQFSAKELQAMLPVIKKQAKGPIYIVDLRQETHGFFNGNAVSWYGPRDWGNAGKTRAAALKDERMRLRKARGQNVVIARLDSKKMPLNPHEIKVEQAMSEEQLAKQNGLRYCRITATDHVWPSAENIDAFIHFVRQLPPDAWLHFHCQAGQGRTTTFMALYDMMKNPAVPLVDILSRQYLLGGAYLAYEAPAGKKPSWKDVYYHQKAEMIRKFYQYVQENYQMQFRTSWQDWLAGHSASKQLS